MIKTAPDTSRPGRDVLLGTAVFGIILAVQIAAEWLMGRLWICKCGYVKFWEPAIYSEGNSQHLLDWYSPTHIEHGILFFFLAWLILRRQPLWIRFAFATVLEAGWEVLENTPMIIDRYRAETISFDYYGDSILNSASDVVMMAVGFIIAARLPVSLTVILTIAIEVFLAWIIRDNLSLNVLMLLWPIDAIKEWQAVLAPGA